MTQRQLIDPLDFASVTSILGWSGSNEAHYLEDFAVYVWKNGFYWYFGIREAKYSLICVSERDLGELTKL